MTTRDTSGDAAWAAMMGEDLPPVTLSGADIRTIKHALEEANYALRKAESSKIYAAASAARKALARIEHAYSAILKSELKR